MLGVSSFITQMAIVIVICVQNKLFKKYGVNSKFGADIPITVLGIVMKINQILSSIIIGIAAGSQPIVGFNYGARKYKRVKRNYKNSINIKFVCFLYCFYIIPNNTRKIN